MAPRSARNRLGACESRTRDANDGKGHLIENDLFADQRRIRTEFPSPQIVAHHHNRIRPATCAIRIDKASPLRRMFDQNIEIVAGGRGSQDLPQSLREGLLERKAHRPRARRHMVMIAIVLIFSVGNQFAPLLIAGSLALENGLFGLRLQLLCARNRSNATPSCSKPRKSRR